MALISAKLKVGEIARVWPETMQVFARYKIDLCCGGADSLEFVAEKHGLDLESLLQEINRTAELGAPAQENS